MPTIIGSNKADFDAKELQRRGLLKKGVEYDAKQEGPFWRVRPRSVEKNIANDRGIREAAWESQKAESGLSSHPNAEPLTDEKVKSIIKDPNNFARQAADNYSRKNLSKPYSPINNTPSSLVKQSPIAQAFMLAASEHPDYKSEVFNAYKKKFPKLTQGVKDYDELVSKAYGALAQETKKQFDSLPVNMSFHRNGEGNYASSQEMLKDVHGNRHLYVYQGGDKHEFLNEVDPKTKLNTNEMFRAVHDFYGHAVHGNQFGPKGEEEAWAAHGGMFSPLAHAAMTAETRGQNSVVNYSGLNAEIKAAASKLDELAYEAKRNGKIEDHNKFKAEKQDLLSNHFQYAPQKSLLLPPEMLSGDYAGGVPSYLKHLIKPEHGVTAELTHFSHNPNLVSTDPRMYGTGIKGAEAARLEDPAAVKNRTYFYEGNPERGEPGLGAHRYHARVSDLYDVLADPLKLRTLALEANRTPYSAMANKGMTNPTQAFTDLERMAREHGYKGVLQRNLSMPTAAVFEPVRVTKNGTNLRDLI
jgi:hypothetical protein